METSIGIDVGTGSARAGIFDAQGTLLAAAVREIARFSPAPDFAQQSTADIWAAVCQAVREALRHAGVAPDTVRGIGFDATCSLVLSDGDGQPVSVSPDGAREQDVVMWLDHRASEETRAINTTGAEPLNYVGGRMSIEMQLPKLRWLKRHCPQSWARATRFWDLPDWLTWRATGCEDRSICSPVCKWGYLGARGLAGEGWDVGFFAKIGLEDLTCEGFAAIGKRFCHAGEAVGGLTARAGKELGLAQGIPVSAGLIDAYAGALGTLLGLLGAGLTPERLQESLNARLAVIAGTSACHIALTPSPVFVPGVWGPYPGALLEGWCALEGGQSAAGALLDAVLNRHGALAELDAQAKAHSISRYDRLEEILTAIAQDAGQKVALLTKDRHIQPDFHGNRAPLADPARRGAISGLGLHVGVEDLALDYLAAIQALGYGTRHILTEMKDRGLPITTLVMSGGLADNPMFVQTSADTTGCAVLCPDQPEPVLLGSAMIGAAAGGKRDLATVAAEMSGEGKTHNPCGGAVADYHARKYRVFRAMQDDFANYRDMMES
ncbi:MAG: FGGY-family carbohydrate kinase [Pseudomonadota bacterium]